MFDTHTRGNSQLSSQVSSISHLSLHMSFNTINWSALKGPERLASRLVVATAWTAALPLNRWSDPLTTKERSEIDRKGREGRRERGGGEKREEKKREEKRREEKRERKREKKRTKLIEMFLFLVKNIISTIPKLYFSSNFKICRNLKKRCKIVNCSCCLTFCCISVFCKSYRIQVIRQFNKLFIKTTH